LPLLALIYSVDPALLLKFITEFSKLSEETKAETVTGNQKISMKTFLPYNKMSNSQQDVVDSLQEEHEDFDEFLAVQAVNELGENENLCELCFVNIKWE